MKLLAILLAALITAAACSLQVVDSPQLRNAIDTRYALTVVPVPKIPGGSIRFTLQITPSPTASLLPTVTPTRSAP